MKEQFEFNSRLSVYKEEFVELRIYTHMYWSPINLFNRDIGCFRQKCETIFPRKIERFCFYTKLTLMSLSSWRLLSSWSSRRCWSSSNLLQEARSLGSSISTDFSNFDSTSFTNLKRNYFLIASSKSLFFQLHKVDENGYPEMVMNGNKVLYCFKPAKTSRLRRCCGLTFWPIKKRKMMSPLEAHFCDLWANQNAVSKKKSTFCKVFCLSQGRVVGWSG